MDHWAAQFGFIQIPSRLFRNEVICPLLDLDMNYANLRLSRYGFVSTCCFERLVRVQRIRADDPQHPEERRDQSGQNDHAIPYCDQNSLCHDEAITRVEHMSYAGSHIKHMSTVCWNVLYHFHLTSNVEFHRLHPV